MANINFPAVSMMSVDLSLEWPGQAIHLGLYSSERHVITRGVGLWRGQIIWDTRGRADNDAEIRAIEAFLIQLEGAANTFDVPMPVDQSDRFADGTDLRITAILQTGSTMRLTCNQMTGLRTGDYVTIENRLFQLTSNLDRGMMQVSPYRPIDVTVTTTDDGGNTITGAKPNGIIRPCAPDESMPMPCPITRTSTGRGRGRYR